MKHFISHIRWSFLALLFVVGLTSASADTYRLQQVTTVTNGGLYVFEQDGYVMNATISNYALQTEKLDVANASLTGKEAYVWKLEQKSTEFLIRNVSIGGSSNYLVKTKNSADLAWSTSSNSSYDTRWKILPQEDNTVIIQTTSSDNRFLGYASATSHTYKAYAESRMSDYPHAIKVYELIKEDESAVAAPTFSPASGTYSTPLNVTITCATDGASIYYTTDETQPTQSSLSYSSPIYIDKTTTINAIAIKDDVVSAVSTATFTITSDGTLQDADFSFSEKNCIVDINAAEFSLPTLTYAYGYNGEIVYSSSNNDVATVDEETGNVTIAGIGTTTITAIGEETEKFSADEASYVLKVYELEDGVFDFTLKYDYGSLMSTKAENTNIDESERTWTSGNVSLKTYGRVSWPNGEKLIVYVKSAGASDKNSTCELSVPNGCLITEIKIEGEGCERLVSANNGSGSLNTTTFTWTGSAQQVTFSHNTESSTSITIERLIVTYIPKVEIGSAEYITYYSQYALDFSEIEGVTAYIIPEVTESTVILQEIKAAPADTPMILHAEAGMYLLKIVDSAPSVGENYLQVSHGDVTGGG